MNEIIIQNTGEIYILSDTSRIGATSFVSYSSLGDVDTLIVDDSISTQDREIIESRVKRLLIT